MNKKLNYRFVYSVVVHIINLLVLALTVKYGRITTIFLALVSVTVSLVNLNVIILRKVQK